MSYAASQILIPSQSLMSSESLLLQLPLWDGATGRRIAPETDRIADAVRDALMDDAAQLADELPEEVAKGMRLKQVQGRGTVACDSARLGVARVPHTLPVTTEGVQVFGIT